MLNLMNAKLLFAKIILYILWQEIWAVWDFLKYLAYVIINNFFILFGNTIDLYNKKNKNS